MKAAMDLFQPRLIDVSVNLRSGEAGMAQHFLNRTQVGAVGEQVCRKGMAQEMRPDFLLQARELGHFLHDLPDARGRQSSAMFAEENFAAGLRLDQKRAVPFASQRSSAAMAFSPTGTMRSRFPFPITRSNFSSRR